jgi:hypothetical protein
MRGIHNHDRIARGVRNTCWVKLVGDLVNIRIAVDLNEQLEISCVIAFIAAHILHEQAIFRLFFVDQSKIKRYALLSLLDSRREMVARVVCINNVSVIIYLVRALPLNFFAKVELDNVITLRCLVRCVV